VNICSTFRCQNSVVKYGSWSRGGTGVTTGTMVNPAVLKLEKEEKMEKRKI